jgi:dienelactone hydrolase
MDTCQSVRRWTQALTEATALLIACSFPVCVTAQSAGATQDSFVSSGKTIVVEAFTPTASGRHPAVLLLYGATGLTSGAQALREDGQNLASNGFSAYLVHYFDATGGQTAGALPVDPNRFRIWTQAVQDAISYLHRQPQVNGNRIGLVGFSLGAFLALWESSQDSRVKACVEYYGGTGLFLGPPTRMPPTLILHGQKDTFVPVAEAYKLRDLLERQHAPYEIKIYSEEGHGFDGGDAADAWTRSLTFLQKNLK